MGSGNAGRVGRIYGVGVTFGEPVGGPKIRVGNMPTLPSPDHFFFLRFALNSSNCGSLKKS